MDVTGIWTTEEIARWAYEGWAEAGALLGDAAALGMVAAVIRQRVVAIVVGALAAAALGMHAHLFTSAVTDDVGLALGIALAAVVGALAVVGAHAFVDGSVRAGGARSIVGATVVLAAVVVAALSLFLVGLGYVLGVLVIGASLRRRSATSTKYRGLRILR